LYTDPAFCRQSENDFHLERSASVLVWRGRLAREKLQASQHHGAGPSEFPDRVDF